jgi:hypothetical protein
MFSHRLGRQATFADVSEVFMLNVWNREANEALPGHNPPFLGHRWIPHSSHSGTPAFDNSIVDGEFFASLDVSRCEIDAVELFFWINSDVGRVAVIYEAIIVAAKNKSVTPGIDVSVVQHGFTEVSWLLFECTWIEVQVKSGREAPDTRVRLNRLRSKNPNPVYRTPIGPYRY